MFLAVLDLRKVAMSFNTSNRPLTPGPLPPGPSRRSPFGRITERFFAEGEQHEAAHWQDVVLPPDDEPEPCVRSGSFDEIPRQRSATITLVVLAACLTFGIVVGARFFLSTGHEVDAAKAAYSQIPPGNAAQATPHGEAAGATETSPAPAVAEPAPAAPPTPAASTGSTSNEEAAIPPSRAHEPASAAGSERAAKAAASVQQPSRPQARKSRALRNYVWSPTAQALVPADSVPPAPSTSPPVDQARGRTTTDTLAPPAADQPTIAPATTGTSPSERAAPAPEGE
jgi:hypothetical protein